MQNSEKIWRLVDARKDDYEALSDRVWGMPELCYGEFRSVAEHRAMLEQEGFRYEGYVDIFDAGPTLECFRDNMHASRQSQLLPVQLGPEDPVPDSLTDDVLWLIGNRKFADWRAIVASAPPRADRLPLLPYAAEALGVGEGDVVRAVPLSPRDR